MFFSTISLFFLVTLFSLIKDSTSVSLVSILFFLKFIFFSGVKVNFSSIFSLTFIFIEYKRSPGREDAEEYESPPNPKTTRRILVANTFPAVKK